MLNIKFGLVRVEDVSLAHLRAVTTPEAKGKRFILCGQSVWMREIAQKMANEFNPQGYKINTGELSKALVWIASIFIKELNNAL